MSRYRTKPVVIEAEQWLGWTPDRAQETRLGLRTHPTSLILARMETREGGYDVAPSDWIITGVAGERYPCKDRIFHATYDEEPS